MGWEGSVLSRGERRISDSESQLLCRQPKAEEEIAKILLTSIRKLFRKLPIIRDVASDRDESHTVGKLLKFPVRRCKFLRLNLREIAATR